MAVIRKVAGFPDLVVIRDFPFGGNRGNLLEDTKMFAFASPYQLPTCLKTQGSPEVGALGFGVPAFYFASGFGLKSDV